MSEFERVAGVNDVREGDMTAVTAPNGDEVLLIKIGGQVYAVAAMCTHQEAWLDAGFVHTASLEIECPLHEGRFDVRTGAVTSEPPTEPLRTYQVRIDGSNILIAAD